MNIVADENIPYVKAAFEQFGKVTTVTGRTLQAEQLKNADILLVRSVTRVNRALLEGSKVRFVASATIGFDHIDLEYLQQKNIAFARAPASNAVSAAEYILAVLAWWSRYKNKDWKKLSVGIIGCGNVGSRVYQRCHALGITCVRNDPPLQEAGEKGLATLEEALACDVVTLHVPLTTEGKHPTRHLLNRDNINRLAEGSLLINAARGDTIDEQALLQRKDLDLVLDCWHGEPLINQGLLQQTLLGTAHIAGYSLDGKIRGTEMIYRACCRHFGVKPQWSAQSVEYEPLPIITGTNDLRDIVLQAYPIEEDSKRLKQLLQGKEHPAAWFDYLRKHYPVRREFAAWQVAASSLTEQDRKTLHSWGFRLV